MLEPPAENHLRAAARDRVNDLAVRLSRVRAFIVPVLEDQELRVGYLAGEPLAGPADWWIETLAGFANDGFDTIVFWPVDPSPDQVELLIGEVVPLLSNQIPRSRRCSELLTLSFSAAFGPGLRTSPQAV